MHWIPSHGRGKDLERKFSLSPIRLGPLKMSMSPIRRLKLLWLTLCQFNTSCEIEFLPVYTPNDEEKNNPKLFATNVRNVMAK